MKHYLGLVLFLFLITLPCLAQNKYEREHRIKKSQFPTLQTDIMLLRPEMKNIRYYKEIDGTKTTYSVKFKKDRLHYHLAYDETGILKYSGFRVKEIDIPEETYQEIKSYLSRNFEKVRVKRIFQQYPANITEPLGVNLKNTFQNLLLPDNIYKLIIIGKKAGENKEFDLWFDAEGKLQTIRQALPANYDHVLY